MGLGDPGWGLMPNDLFPSDCLIACRMAVFRIFNFESGVEVFGID